MPIDLRSDTVTRPTDGMRRAMFDSEVGDDVFGEDPTVNQLERRIAELLGKEASLFVASGVMANQLAIKIHTTPGDEIIVERSSHILNYESGAPGLISGVQINVLDGERGVLSPEEITSAIRPSRYWSARTRLLCLENTLNQAGGRIYPIDALRGASEAAHSHGLRVHLDGARLWNASAVTNISPATYAETADTVSVCISKGLGAPVGSVLAGSTEAIAEARRYRKLLGGGMRQVGILAAAGLYALDHHRTRLPEDHRNARRLADGIAELPGIQLDPSSVETNIVMFEVDHGKAELFVGRLKAEGVLVAPFGPETIRATTHLDVSSADIDRVITVFGRLFQ